MLDLKFIRENTDLVRTSIKNRGMELDVNRFIHLDSERRTLLKKAESLKHKKNIASDEIAKMLNNTQIPTKKGGLWAKKTISKILKNPTYCGYLHWEDFINKSDHEKIIDESDFDKIQNIIAQRRGVPAKKLTK